MPTGVEIDAMTGTEYKVLENRLRRAADRQGLRLQKSRQRDPRGLLHGTYQLVDVQTSAPMLTDQRSGRGYGLHLDEVARYLFGDR
jgi:hypothetical protein